MNDQLVKKIADAVLYEGYMLYPYRASAVKNRQRFNWGVLVPPDYAEAQNGTEHRAMQTEVLILGNNTSEIDLKLRFLHLREREIFHYDEKSGEFRAVESLKIGEKIFQTWQEAVEAEVGVPDMNLDGLNNRIKLTAFSFPETEETETLRDAHEKVAGKIVRRQSELDGIIEVQAQELNRQSPVANRQLFKLTVRISNTTPFENAANRSRDEALAQSLVSSHAVLEARGSEFISLLEPPEELAEAVKICQNVAAYPVLVGAPGEKNCFLASPIILYDYPEIAPESAGDLFDGGEIDEILSLRIMTMTDEEKREMQSLDERARQMLERTENLTAEQLMKMHGRLRQPRAFGDEDFFNDDFEGRGKAAKG